MTRGKGWGRVKTRDNEGGGGEWREEEKKGQKQSTRHVEGMSRFKRGHMRESIEEMMTRWLIVTERLPLELLLRPEHAKPGRERDLAPGPLDIVHTSGPVIARRASKRSVMCQPELVLGQVSSQEYSRPLVILFRRPIRLLDRPPPPLLLLLPPRRHIPSRSGRAPPIARHRRFLRRRVPSNRRGSTQRGRPGRDDRS